MRLLTADESREVWALLKELWNIDKFSNWYPLSDTNQPQGDLIAFDYERLESNDGYELMKEILIGKRLSALIQLDEDDFGSNDFEVPTTDIDFSPKQLDKFWCNKSAEIVIHTSHEGIVTVAGDLLIAELKYRLANWHECEWRIE